VGRTHLLEFLDFKLLFTYIPQTLTERVMKSNIENISNLERKLSIEIPVTEVNSEFNSAFKYLQKNVEIKGFRKGKTPIDKIRTLYKEKVKDDVAQNLVQNFYIKALQEHELMPIGMPKIDFQAPEEGEAFSFSASFEIQPEIELKQIEGLTVKKEALAISEEQVEKNIEQVLENQSQLEDVVLVRELKEGDFADIDFTGYMDGSPLENGAAQGHVLEIGSDSFIPGFETAIIGMKPGEEKTIQLKFPDDYHVDKLKGKPVEFKVVLNKIKQKNKPTLDDEFVKKLGEHQTVEEFRNQIKKDMEDGETKRIEHDLKNRLFKSLVAANPFDVPKSLVDEQRGALVEDFKRRMQGQGIGEHEFAAYQEKWEEDFSETAEFMVRSGLLIQTVAKANDLFAKKEDIEAKLQEFADQTGLDLSKVKEFYQQGQQSQNLEFQVTEDKVFQFLLEKANVSEVSADDLKENEEA
jgi:trigger factor